MKVSGLIAAALMLLAAGNLYAQEATPPVEPTIEVEATAETTAEMTAEAPAEVSIITADALPPMVRLEGLRPVYQLLNRCSAAALTIQLSYFQWQGTYDDTMRSLNPSEEDVSVRLDEMIAFAAQFGLKGVERVGGTIDLLKLLVANGFPVLVENVYYDGPNAFQDWMSHNRVIMGYDDSAQVLLSFDSLLGNGENNQGRPIPYEDADRRWRDFNRDYLVLYRPEDEAKLQQLMGDFWDETYAAEHALLQAQAEIDAGTSDSFTVFNQGWSLTLLGRHEEAVEAFDRARGIGLPWRMMWYVFAPFEAYYAVGRYDDMLELARAVIGGTPGVEESYYYAGLAYEQQGDLTRAKSNFEVALWRNQNFSAAQTALARVGG